MNLDQICTAPHAQGFIKVGCEMDPAFGDRRTLNEFVVAARHHDQEANEARLARHPISDQLVSQQGGEGGKITEIPITCFFNKTSNALGIKYQAYASNGNAPVCTGNGKTARRVVSAGDGTQTFQEVTCVGPEGCELVQSGAAKCSRQVRMTVQIKGQGDPLSVFEVRSSSLNTYKALRGQLALIERRFGGLRHVPLKLKLWNASNEASNYQLFTLMRLELDAESEAQAMQKAKETRDALAAAGVNDEVDDALVPVEPGDEDALLGAADYQSVREFYETPATRREGTQAVTPSTARGRRGIPPELGAAANNAIASAVQKSGSAPATVP